MTTHNGGRKFIQIMITHVNAMLELVMKYKLAYLLSRSRLIFLIHALSKAKRQMMKAAFRKLLIKQSPWKSRMR